MFSKYRFYGNVSLVNFTLVFIHIISLFYAWTGAGQQIFKAEDIAGALFGAIDDFTAAQRLSRLREVRLVIFHKQKYTMEPVIKSLHKNIQAAVMSAQQKSSGWMSRIKEFKGIIECRIQFLFSVVG